MKGRTLAVVCVVAALAVCAGCSKSDPKAAVKKFHMDFVALHEEGVRKGFFGCLYGEVSLPQEAKEFIDKLKRRFESDPEGFIKEKSEGCKANLEQTIDQIRLLVAPTAELGAARDAYGDAATTMIDGWGKVHKAFVDYETVVEARSDFNGTYAPLLEKAGNQGWALMQKCRMWCPPEAAPPAGTPPPPPDPNAPPACTKDATVENCMTRIGAGPEELKNGYRYLNFVTCILKSYDVDVNGLLPEDTKAVEEGRGYLMGVKLLRDKLTELCTGEYGSATNILEWGTRVSANCYPLLEAADPAKPELFDKMVTWWSSDGTRVGGEAYSSYAVLADTCVKQTIDLAPPLKDFLTTYAAFVQAASAMNDALLAAEK
jgi:hypothetical protein